MKSIIYWHPKIYTLAMRFLYSEYFYERYKRIVDLIPSGAEVVDICCGDCYIYFNYLKDKNVKYLGLDINETFVNAAQKKGARAKRFDILKDQLPHSDYILMQASMYHFIPMQDSVMQKILNATRKTAIISEPVINLSTSDNFLLRNASKILTSVGTGHSSERFNKQTLLNYFSKHNVTSVYEIEGGREIIGVFNRE